MKRLLAVFTIIILSLSACTQADDPWQYLLKDGSLEQWDTYLAPTNETFEELGTEWHEQVDKEHHVGLNTDPVGVFSTVDKDGEQVLRISGEIFGGIVSKEAFGNYHLVLEYAWGEKKFGPRADKVRNSGLLYHSNGDFGAALNSWLPSHECQMMHDDAGSWYGIGGAAMKAEAVQNEEETYVWTTGAELVEFGKGNWKLQHGSNAENPLGQWNKMELYVVGDEAVHIVNGKTALVVKETTLKNADGEFVPVTSGKIQIQSEGAELFIKSMKLMPIEQIPADVL